METNQYKPFLLPIIIFLGVVLSGFFLLKPKITQVLEFRREFTSQKGKLAQLTTKTAFLEGLDRVELEEKTRIALQTLPAEKNLPAGLAAVRNLVMTAGLQLKSIQVEPGEISSASAQKELSKKGNLPYLEFKIAFTGDQVQLKDFLKKVQTTAPLMRVTALAVSQKEDQSASEVDCNLDIFFLSLPDSLGTAEKPLDQITSQEEETYRQLAKMTPFPEETLIPVQSGKENPFSL